MLNTTQISKDFNCFVFTFSVLRILVGTGNTGNGRSSTIEMLQFNQDLANAKIIKCQCDYIIAAFGTFSVSYEGSVIVGGG